MQIGPMDAEAIVRGVAEQRRNCAPGTLDEMLNANKGLPTVAQHEQQVWREPEDLANEPAANESADETVEGEAVAG